MCKRWDTPIFTRLIILPPLLGGHKSLDARGASGAPGGRGHGAAHAVAPDPARRAPRRPWRLGSTPGEGKTYASQPGCCFGLCHQEVTANKCDPHGAAPPATVGDRHCATVAGRTWQTGPIVRCDVGGRCNQRRTLPTMGGCADAVGPGRPRAAPHVQAALRRASSRSSGAAVSCRGTVALLCSNAEFYYTL